MIVWISAFSIATSRLGVKRKVAAACRTKVWPRGSITKILAPRFAACLKKVAATGWFSVGRAPMTMITSASAAAVNGEGTAPVAVSDPLEARGGEVERLFPCCLTEMRIGVGRVDVGIVLRDAVFA